MESRRFKTGSRPQKWTVHFMLFWFKTIQFWAFWPSTFTKFDLKVIFSLFKYQWMFLTNSKPNLIWQDLWHDLEEIFRVSITLTRLEISMDSLAQKWLHMYEFSNLIPKNTYRCILQNKIADFEILYFTIPSLHQWCDNIITSPWSLESHGLTGKVGFSFSFNCRASGPIWTAWN